MKHRALNQLIFLAVVMVLFVGCRTTPVFNVENATINTVSGKEPTLEDVSRAIVSASGNSNPPWNMQIVKPGHIVATLHNRTHMAQVNIHYTTEGYSITYKDSADLKYDAEKGTIHEGYNKWIQRLDSNIRMKVNML
ncbi:MAG: hypothetical protein WD032_03700 [Nitrospirales bacterium]